jgi:hypothetical protein
MRRVKTTGLFGTVSKHGIYCDFLFLEAGSDERFTVFLCQPARVHKTSVNAHFGKLHVSVTDTETGHFKKFQKKLK